MGQEAAKTLTPALDSEQPQRAEDLDEGDVRLIRWMWELTPGERLRALEGFVEDVRILQNAKRV